MRPIQEKLLEAGLQIAFNTKLIFFGALIQLTVILFTAQEKWHTLKEPHNNMYRKNHFHY